MRFSRKFTLDGHLVGSIGEVVAAYFYELVLEAQSVETIDAWTSKEPRRSVQIKLTGGNSVSISDSNFTPDILIVLKIKKGVGFEEIYNGRFPTDLLKGVRSSKRRVKMLSLTTLRKEQSRVVRCLSDHGRIQELNSRFSPEAQ